MNLDRRHIQVIANALLHGASRSSTRMTEVGRISHLKAERWRVSQDGDAGSARRTQAPTEVV